ncbi:hypothetical protein [Larkinella harenae]
MSTDLARKRRPLLNVHTGLFHSARKTLTFLPDGLAVVFERI